MADDTDITSGMPEPTDIGLDPTAEMPHPTEIGLQPPEQHTSPFDPFNPSQHPVLALGKAVADEVSAHPKEVLSAATGIPRIAAVANPITPRIAGAAGRLGALSGSVGAALDPEHASEDLAEGERRAQDWSSNVYKFAEYLPKKLETPEGTKLADAVLNAPGEAGSYLNDKLIRPWAGDAVADTVGEISTDLASTLGVPDIKGTSGAIARGAERARSAVENIQKPKAPPPPTPNAPLTPDNVGTGVTAEQLRSQPNPIPPPEGTAAHERQQPAAAPPTEAPELGNQPQDMSLDPQARAAERARIAAERAKQIGLTGELEPEPVPKNAAQVEGEAARIAAMTDEQRQAYYAQNRIPTTGETTEQLQARLNAEADARGKTLGSRPAGDDQRGSVRLFSSPAEEGPKETPTPEMQGLRAQHLDKLDKLSGGMLPSRRMSALTGDYNATGDDYQAKEVEPAGGPMKTQLASENAALHKAADTIHSSLDSAHDDSVDPQTVSNRGRTIRNAVEAIQKHFDDATDGFYEAARAQNQGRPIPKLQRVSDYLNDDSNFTNDAEIGLQRAAKQRMERLWTTGDPDKGAPPGSVNAAERLREFLNEKGKNPSAMGVASDLKNHLDMDVAEHGGPGMFDAARKMRRHSYQMLEEPTGIKKLLAPSDSQGINHAIPTEKVADYVADLPQDQHEHVLNVLRAGAHLAPDIAEKSAAAMREIQAHVISRIHDAATDKASGAWNARKFYNKAAEYGPKLPALFKERPDVLDHLQTLNDAGNTLHMDKHYPGAGAQVSRTGMVTHAVEGIGALASGIAHELPMGRILGRGIEAGTEKLTGKMGEQARNKATLQRLVDRNGKSRGSVQLFNDNDLNQGRDRDTFHGKTVERNPRTEYNANSQLAGGRQRLTPEQQSIIDRLGGGAPLGERVGGGKQRGAIGEPSQRDAVTHKSEPERKIGGDVINHRYRTPNGGGLDVTETPGLGVRQGRMSYIPEKERGNGWGTRMLQRAVDDAHAAGQVWHSDSQISDSQANAYSNLKKLGYDVRMKDNDHRGGAYHAVGDHVFEVRPGANKAPLGAKIPGQRGAVGDISRALRERDAAKAAPRNNELESAKEAARLAHENASRVASEVSSRRASGVSRLGDTFAPGEAYNAAHQAQRNYDRLSAKAEQEKSLGSRIGGGKQRGSVKVTDGDYEAPDELKNFIRKMAPAHRVDENGPANWEDLKARRNEKVMPINPQGAEGSIYGDVPTNIAFRAWHDKTHLDVNGGFDHDGELKTAQEQLRQAKAAGLSEEAQKALWADTWETFKHHEDHGEFPQNPRAFVASRMADKTPLGARIPGQRGAVGDLGKRIANKISSAAENVGDKLERAHSNVEEGLESAYDRLRHAPFGIGRAVMKGEDLSERVGDKLDRASTSVDEGLESAYDRVRRLGRDKQRGSVKVTDDEAPRSEEEGSTLNVGLHQGKEGDKGFRKMSKQEAQAAVESTGAKVTKNTVLTPKQHGVYEPTAVLSTDRPLTPNEMQQVLAKTKQSAIPQRTGQGDEEMHVAPGHEETAKKEGWDTFNPDYFREHDGRTMSDAMKNPAAPNPYPPHPNATVKDPVRSAFPGIYDDPKEIMQRLGEGKPESPHLKEIFGKTRKDLHDDALARGDVEPKTPIPGIAPKGAGSAHAHQVKTPENAERIRNIIQAYKEHDPSGYHGMVGWYEMDPMYHSIKKILGGSKDAADKVFHTLNSLTAYASPMSPVGVEIKRGTAAAMMAAEGNFDKFAKHGNLPQAKAPAALQAKNFELGNEGTMAHGSQAPAMGRFLESGQEANAVKTGTYRRSSDAPSRTGSEHQNTQAVGDSHWSRGVGLADVRNAKDFDGSAKGTEMKVLAKWYHDEVARHPDIDLPSTSAQAVQWGALSKETGVDSPIGAPKLEIWADMIAKAAEREGIPPKEMWTRIVKRLAK